MEEQACRAAAQQRQPLGGRKVSATGKNIEQMSCFHAVYNEVMRQQFTTTSNIVIYVCGLSVSLLTNVICCSVYLSNREVRREHRELNNDAAISETGLGTANDSL